MSALPWTAEEEALLLKLMAKGRGPSAIALAYATHGTSRTLGAIRNKIHMLKVAARKANGTPSEKPVKVFRVWKGTPTPSTSRRKEDVLSLMPISLPYVSIQEGFAEVVHV